VSAVSAISDKVYFREWKLEKKVFRDIETWNKKGQGAGKSTLGNLLVGAPHNDGPFPTSAHMVILYLFGINRI